jgi:hypothetical protein
MMSKCEFRLREVSFLGHVIFSNEIAANPSKVDAVFAMGGSKDGSENKTFLGLTKFHKRFIEGFS